MLLDGAALAARLREEVRAEILGMGSGAEAPGLRVLLVGSHPASETYVASKTKAAREAGLTAETVRLPGEISGRELSEEIARANRSPEIDGILVQLPLPARLDSRAVLDAVDPLKDVDGFHPENAGLLLQGRPRFVPCTPAGVLALLDANGIALSGRRAVVIGRSDIVGKPLAVLLIARDATVTICHSRTPDLAGLCRQADVLVAAVGRPGLVTPDFVRPGAAVIDVGINRLTSLDDAPLHLRSERIAAVLAARGRILVGDVDFDRVREVAGWITPVPGGVGPLTVAMLLKNTVTAARLRKQLRRDA